LFARSRHGSTTSTRSRNSTGRRIDLADGLRLVYHRTPRAWSQVASAEGDNWAQAIAGGSEEVVGEVGMRSTPPSGGWRYGRVDPCPGIGCASNLVPKSATSDGAKVPAVPVAVFDERNGHACGRQHLRSAICATRFKGPCGPASDTDHTGPSISPASMPMARSRGLPRAGELKPYGSALAM
jgi:hypothetical protein